MRIIVDSNIIMSAMIKQGTTRTILTNPKIEFYTVKFAIQEIRKYKKLITKKSGLTEEEFEIMLSLTMDNIKIIEKQQAKTKLKEAKKLIEKIDSKDVPILSGALSIPNEGLWTMDKHLKKQKKAKVYNTKEIIELVE